MDHNSLVTINILSFNRKEELRNTIKNVMMQSYKNIEVIVVDNASTDGAPDMVKEEYPQVKLIRLKKNIGVSGWNEGFKAAAGKFVLVLDDDSYPSEHAIRNGVDLLALNKKTGVIAYSIYNTRIENSETEEFKDTPSLFVGCGALIRKEVLRKVGLFNELIFIYLHELDFSARVYNAGFFIKYLSNSTVFHKQSLKSRDNSPDPFNSGFRFYNYFVSYYIFLFQRFDYKFMIIYGVKWSLNRFIVAVKYNYLREFIRAIFKVMHLFPVIMRGRKKLNYSTQKFYHFGNIPLFDKQYFH
ncbi:MAG: glycosyltransferase family 2 protein [Bacteroidetes bacterium]|nr:glycosyltransferase family 2 protein [Bacteroidota bacterium]